MTNIDEAKARLRRALDANDFFGTSDIRTILDALDAAEHERDEAIHARMVERRDSNVTHQERNELAAVIERVRAEAEAWVGAPDGEAAPTGAVGALFLSIINSVPVDVLRERDAEKWDEGAKWAAVECGAIGSEDTLWLAPGDNPYRIEKGEQ